MTTMPGARVGDRLQAVLGGLDGVPGPGRSRRSRGRAGGRRRPPPAGWRRCGGPGARWRRRFARSSITSSKCVRPSARPMFSRADVGVGVLDPEEDRVDATPAPAISTAAGIVAVGRPGARRAAAPAPARPWRRRSPRSCPSARGGPARSRSARRSGDARARTARRCRRPRYIPISTTKSRWRGLEVLVDRADHAQVAVEARGRDQRRLVLGEHRADAHLGRRLAVAAGDADHDRGHRGQLVASGRPRSGG